MASIWIETASPVKHDNKILPSYVFVVPRKNLKGFCAYITFENVVIFKI